MRTQTNTAPLISVIIPAYKTGKYPRHCVESIFNQHYPNIEAIIVDDGSPDDVPRICDALAEENKLIKVAHQSNRGVSATRNNGLKIARGEYIMYLDSNDYWGFALCLRCFANGKSGKDAGNKALIYLALCNLKAKN